MPQSWTRENLAWAAGLFEGEGCITRTNRVPVARLGTTDLDVLERFHLVMGFGRVYEMGHTRNHPRWKPASEWTTTTFEEAQATIAVLWPWLRARRRARGLEVLGNYWQRRLAAARGDGTLAGELFGKRASDLAPAEYTEYRRVQQARLRVRRSNA
jgi:hypothetical protein